MKSLSYFLFGFIYNFFTLFTKRDKHSAVLMHLHNEGESGALSYIANTLKDFGDYNITAISRAGSVSGVKGLIHFFLQDTKTLAGASYVFLNDNFMPLRFMRVPRGVKVVQLWHGEGAFKRFGLGQPQDKKTVKLLTKGNRNLTEVVVTSKGVVPIYAEAFGVPESKVKAYGSPRMDYFFSKSAEGKQDLKERFLEKYPQCKGKTLVLYAPTFRDDKLSNDALFNAFPFDQWDSVAGEYALLVRAHPQVGGVVPVSDKFVNAGNYPSVSELALICDILITDYSSIAMDFAVQGKPTLFFAFDLDYYCTEERGFYFDYETYVPGTIAKTGEELLKALATKDFSLDKQSNFLKINFDYLDAYNSKRILEKIL